MFGCFRPDMMYISRIKESVSLPAWPSVFVPDRGLAKPPSGWTPTSTLFFSFTRSSFRATNTVSALPCRRLDIRAFSVSVLLPDMRLLSTRPVPRGSAPCSTPVTLELRPTTESSTSSLSVVDVPIPWASSMKVDPTRSRFEERGTSTKEQGSSGLAGMSAGEYCVRNVSHDIISRCPSEKRMSPGTGCSTSSVPRRLRFAFGVAPPLRPGSSPGCPTEDASTGIFAASPGFRPTLP
mmetsp:Transcript_16388/g.46218  ORF Transcript_16388/g.46218 Transcript_16388/m.46218 type:complete len:237 (-) Transcript_16388:634-1344(-)